MKYTKDERLEIGRRIYDSEVTRYQAAEEYGISDQTARNYMRQYRDKNHLPAKCQGKRTCQIKLNKFANLTEPQDMEAYEAMTKEELIQALIQARINEARLKKTTK